MFLQMSIKSCHLHYDYSLTSVFYVNLVFSFLPLLALQENHEI